jgi:hypothetical protein
MFSNQQHRKHIFFLFWHEIKLLLNYCWVLPVFSCPGWQTAPSWSVLLWRTSISWPQKPTQAGTVALFTMNSIKFQKLGFQLFNFIVRTIFICQWNKVLLAFTHFLVRFRTKNLYWSFKRVGKLAVYTVHGVNIINPILPVQGCILPCLVWGPMSLKVWDRKI